MDLSLAWDGPDRLVATLREGLDETTVSTGAAVVCCAALEQALADARASGYGECFWPEPTGHYWWMLRRDEERLEVVVMWSRGGAGGWQHVFRAADSVDWFDERLAAEIARLAADDSVGDGNA